MPSRAFDTTIESLLRVFAELNLEGYYFINAMSSTSSNDVRIILDPTVDGFLKYGNNKFYIYHDDILEQENPIHRINNIHQGVIFVRSDSDGGFFLNIYFFIDENRNVSGEIGYCQMSRFGDEWRYPPPELKERYVSIHKKLKAKPKRPKT